MPTYYRLGEVPPKRHTQFRKPDGGLYAEELFGEEGFAGVYSLLYHYYLPPAVAAVEALPPRRLDVVDEPAQRHHHLRTSELPAGGDAVGGRQPLLFNDDIVIALVRPTEPMAYFFKNATADELFFVHEGSGTLRTQFGPLPFGPGDYLMVPRGTIYQFVFDTADNRLLVLEARGGITLPARYRNEYGQLLEHAPYWERDFRKPARLETVLEQGEYEVRVQVGERLTRLRQAHHPFDVVGWDGYLYPWAFNIHDFEPIAGRLHQPPTVHQTFAGDGFVVCSFCPRPLDWDPRAVPIPYYHSNLDCDEVIYYVAGTYRARRGIAPGSITWHPRGLPHGPQPGAIEASLGLRETDELAVMVDTFRPLRLARAAVPIDDATYTYSWQAAPAR